MKLTAVQEKFIIHWGEMGTRWGINRTMAQIHALLYISPQPLPAETIAQVLSVARSNVSNSLRELQGWGIIRIQHILGDRRDHYESMKDVWEMCQIILDERKKREIDPTIALLRECVEEAKKSGTSNPENAVTRQRLEDMLSFFETMSSWYTQIRLLPRAATIRFVKMGGRVRKLFSPKAG
jgi:DNA-binding transcriptional regulator GbsR (MarR family)